MADAAVNNNPVDPITGIQEGPIVGLDTSAQNAWEGPVIEQNKAQQQEFLDNANRILTDRYNAQAANAKYIWANHDPNFPAPQVPLGYRLDASTTPWTIVRDVDLKLTIAQPTGTPPPFVGNPIGKLYGRSAGPAGVWPREVNWYLDASKERHDTSPYEPTNWQSMGVQTTKGVHVYGGGRYQLFGWATPFSDSPLDKSPRSIRGDERLWADIFSADPAPAQAPQ